MRTYIFILLALFAAACSSHPVMKESVDLGAAQKCPGVDYDDEEGSILILRRLYQDERFAELDTALGCLVPSKSSFSSGKPAGAIAYQMFRREMRAPGATQVDVQRVERWAQLRPSSVFAEFAALRLRYAFSWNHRGSASASETVDEQWRAFRQGLADTEAALSRASPELRNTSLWHQLLLAVAGDTNSTRDNMVSVFEAGVERWPTNYDFHEVMLSRLVPRWGGSWAQVDAVVQHFANERKGEEQDAMYARLYANLLLATGDDPRETRMNWPRMKRGMETLVALYPDPRHLNLAASFACVYKDAPYLKSSLVRIPVDRRRPAAWLSGTDFQSCSS